MSENAQVIENYEITDNLKMYVSLTFDEEKLFLEVDYLNGKYTIQKTFKNNYIGLELLGNAKKKFSTEQSIKEYFNIQE